MSDDKRPALSTALSYQDPKAALIWLEEAFGFEPVMVILDGEGRLAHSEMRFGDGLIMVGSEWSATRKSPRSIGGYGTQSVHVHLEADIDAHFARAVAAGAVVEQGLENQFYGDRTYRVFDPEGHLWTFGQTVEVIAEADWTAATGLSVRSRL